MCNIISRLEKNGQIERTWVGNMGKIIEVDLEVGPIMVPLEVKPEIYIDLEFNINNKELEYMESLIGSSKEVRKQEIGRLYFVKKHTLEEVGAILGVSKSQIQRETAEIKAEILNIIKKDLRVNKKLLGHMVELMLQVNHQTAIIWGKIEELDSYAELLRQILRRADEQVSSGLILTETELVDKTFNKLLTIHDKQLKYFNALRQQTMTMLSILDTFGLAGKDAMEIIMSGGVDIDVKIQQAKETIISLIEIVKIEVADLETRKKIFSRLANDIRIRALENHSENKE
jgi:hypothetical protein